MIARSIWDLSTDELAQMLEEIRDRQFLLAEKQSRLAGEQGQLAEAQSKLGVVMIARDRQHPARRSGTPLQPERR